MRVQNWFIPLVALTNMLGGCAGGGGGGGGGGGESTVAASFQFDFTQLTGDPAWRTHDRKASVSRQGNREVLTLDEQANEGLVWYGPKSFANGTINCEVRGKDAFQQSFVGIAFHMKDNETYDAIYFRPFNFKSDDPSRLTHMVQYISMPGSNWDTLRENFPGKYEAKVDPIPDPNDWFKVRIEINAPTVKVFVNNSAEPSLTVTQLSKRGEGSIGVFAGDGSGGDFANLTFTPAR